MTLFTFLKLLGCLALLMFGMKMMSVALQKLTGGGLRKVLGTMTTNRVTGIFTGALVTTAVQSSTATTVMTVSFVNAGLLTLSQAISVIMGANIGTTVTAWIIALFGFSIPMSALVFPLFALGLAMSYMKSTGAKSFGEFVFGFSFLFLGIATLRENAIAMDLPHNEFVMSFFTSTAKLGFLSYLIFMLIGGVLTVCVQSSVAMRLRFISGGLLSTAELSLLEAREEINHFAMRAHRMFGFVPELLKLENGDEFSKLFARIEKYEGISDNMEVEIANYLNRVAEGKLSGDSKTQLRCMLREISEIESICDSCYNMSRVINRKFKAKERFTEDQLGHIRNIWGLCDQALTQMEKVLADTDSLVDPHDSLNIENEINIYRTQLKENNVVDINERKYDYQTGVNYMDIIGDSEKLGDYAINVVEAHTQVKLTT